MSIIDQDKHNFYPIFLSMVFVVRNQSASIEGLLANAESEVASLVSDYEIIVIDNASDDDSLSKMKDLTSANGMANLQVYALTKEVDADTGSWVGLENALGDFVVVIDPLVDDVSIIPMMLDRAVSGVDVVFASNKNRPSYGLAYNFAYFVFNSLYSFFAGIHLENEAPHCRILSKSLVNFILQHSQPSVTYRHLPATGGFSKEKLEYSANPHFTQSKDLMRSIDRGMGLLVSTTQVPMRLVTVLSLFGAGMNLLYSFYVIAIVFLKDDVAAGWVSLSLQQSGMFFLISLVLLVLGEYILQMARLSNEGPLYHIAQEFTSARMTRHEKLNVEEVGANNSQRTEPPASTKLQ